MVWSITKYCLSITLFFLVGQLVGCALILDTECGSGLDICPENYHCESGRCVSGGDGDSDCDDEPCNADEEDGCCPSGCNASDDLDCCNEARCSLSPDDCCNDDCSITDDVDCCNEALCENGDGCCPLGCDGSNDDDCCDGTCGEDDGCCPPGCEVQLDVDCCAQETCQGDMDDGCCPPGCTALSDINCCDPETDCIAGDGLCPGCCSGDNDSDCCETIDDCDDDNLCTDESCDDRVCQVTVRTEGSTCEGTFWCRVGETCDAFGFCDPASGEEVCEDDIICTADSCNEDIQICINDVDHEQCLNDDHPFCAPDADEEDVDEYGCTAATPCPGGTNAECDDGLFCNGEETCVDGFCEPGVPPECDDGFACTEDICDRHFDRGDGTMGGCIYAPINANCSDDLDCNGDELCRPTDGEADARTGCVAGTPIDCNDAIDCTDDACVEGSGSHTCTHTPNDSACDDGDPCTDDTCDAVTGCSYTPFSCQSEGDGCCPSGCSIDSTHEDYDADCCETTDCTGGDGCCPSACDHEMDDDCP